MTEMNVRPIGNRHSADYQHTVLINWARRAKKSIGQEGWNGLAIFVEPCARGGNCAFITEGRGQAFAQGRIMLTFNTCFPQTRRLAFRRLRKNLGI